MSDMGDDFREARKESQQRRAGNRQSGRDALTKAGIAYEAKNGGAHLIVAARFDYWPGTGLWRERGGNREGRGLRGLIKALQS